MKTKPGRPSLARDRTVSANERKAARKAPAARRNQALATKRRTSRRYESGSDSEFELPI